MRPGLIRHEPSQSVISLMRRERRNGSPKKGSNHGCVSAEYIGVRGLQFHSGGCECSFLWKDSSRLSGRLCYACPDMQTHFAQLLDGKPLSESQAEEVFEHILLGQADDAQIGALLALIQHRGATVDELVGAARAMRRHSQRVPTDDLPAGARVLDTCGTGGTPKTFNISTAAAIIAAAAGQQAGVYVAKHGNRSRSGRGSAEVLAMLGVNIDAPIEVQAKCLKEVGVCFCFAIRHHPATKHAAVARKSLGFPTIFNLLGPLTNPAMAPMQLLGVFDREFVEPMAQAVLRLGAKRAMVVHGFDGIDEITTTDKTFIAHVKDGAVTMEQFDPAALGIERATLDELRARDLDHAAEMIRSILAGDGSAGIKPARDIALLNAAAALVVTDAAHDMAQGLEQAQAAIESGAASHTLNDLARVSNEQP
jgi:anthranilate phosphoribosyltransferase